MRSEDMVFHRIGNKVYKHINSVSDFLYCL